MTLYGCGDFIYDYEGIRGYAGYRGDLAVAYVARRRATDGALTALTLWPYKIRGLRLQRADVTDCEALRSILDRECAPLGTRVTNDASGELIALASN